MNTSETVSDDSSADQPSEFLEPALLQLLDHRYGDGLVYLREDDERDLLTRAIRLGLVSPDGYITPKGQSAIARLAS